MDNPETAASGMDQLCTCFMVRSLSRRISQLYDDILAPTGLRGTQFALLAHARTLDGCEPLMVSVLAERMNTDRTTLTRNIRALQGAGLIETRAGKDARSRCVVVTPAGEATFRAALPLWREAQSQVRSMGGAESIQELERIVRQVLPRLSSGEAA